MPVCGKTIESRTPKVPEHEMHKEERGGTGCVRGGDEEHSERHEGAWYAAVDSSVKNDRCPRR